MDDNIIYHPLWEIDNGYNVNICQWCLENPMIMGDNGKCILQILPILLDGMIFCDVRGRLLTLTVDLIHLIRTWYLDSESLAFAHRKYGILFISFSCQASKIPDTSTKQRDWIHLDLYDISDFALQGCWYTLEWWTICQLSRHPCRHPCVGGPLLRSLLKLWGTWKLLSKLPTDPIRSNSANWVIWNCSERHLESAGMFCKPLVSICFYAEIDHL